MNERQLTLAISSCITKGVFDESLFRQRYGQEAYNQCRSIFIARGLVKNVTLTPQQSRQITNQLLSSPSMALGARTETEEEVRSRVVSMIGSILGSSITPLQFSTQSFNSAFGVKSSRSAASPAPSAEVSAAPTPGGSFDPSRASSPDAWSEDFGPEGAPPPPPPPGFAAGAFSLPKVNKKPLNPLILRYQSSFFKPIMDELYPLQPGKTDVSRRIVECYLCYGALGQELLSKLDGWSQLIKDKNPNQQNTQAWFDRLNRGVIKELVQQKVRQLPTPLKDCSFDAGMAQLKQDVAARLGSVHHGSAESLSGCVDTVIAKIGANLEALSAFLSFEPKDDQGYKVFSGAILRLPDEIRDVLGIPEQVVKILNKRNELVDGLMDEAFGYLCKNLEPGDAEGQEHYNDAYSRFSQKIVRLLVHSDSGLCPRTQNVGRLTSVVKADLVKKDEQFKSVADMNDIRLRGFLTGDKKKFVEMVQKQTTFSFLHPHRLKELIESYRSFLHQRIDRVLPQTIALSGFKIENSQTIVSEVFSQHGSLSDFVVDCMLNDGLGQDALKNWGKNIDKNILKLASLGDLLDAQDIVPVRQLIVDQTRELLKKAKGNLPMLQFDSILNKLCDILAPEMERLLLTKLTIEQHEEVKRLQLFGLLSGQKLAAKVDEIGAMLRQATIDFFKDASSVTCIKDAFQSGGVLEVCLGRLLESPVVQAPLGGNLFPSIEFLPKAFAALQSASVVPRPLLLALAGKLVSPNDPVADLSTIAERELKYRQNGQFIKALVEVVASAPEGLFSRAQDNLNALRQSIKGYNDQSVALNKLIEEKKKARQAIAELSDEIKLAEEEAKNAERTEISKITKEISSKRIEIESIRSELKNKDDSFKKAQKTLNDFYNSQICQAVANLVKESVLSEDKSLLMNVDAVLLFQAALDQFFGKQAEALGKGGLGAQEQKDRDSQLAKDAIEKAKGILDKQMNKLPEFGTVFVGQNSQPLEGQALSAKMKKEVSSLVQSLVSSRFDVLSSVYVSKDNIDKKFEGLHPVLYCLDYFLENFVKDQKAEVIIKERKEFLKTVSSRWVSDPMGKDETILRINQNDLKYVRSIIKLIRNKEAIPENKQPSDELKSYFRTVKTNRLSLLGLKTNEYKQKQNLFLEKFYNIYRSIIDENMETFNKELRGEFLEVIDRDYVINQDYKKNLISTFDALDKVDIINECIRDHCNAYLLTVYQRLQGLVGQDSSQAI